MESHQSNNERQRLPHTVLARILSYLDPESLARAAAISHQFRDLAYSEELWKAFVTATCQTTLNHAVPRRPFDGRISPSIRIGSFLNSDSGFLVDEEPRGQLVIARFNTALICID